MSDRWLPDQSGAISDTPGFPYQANRAIVAAPARIAGRSVHLCREGEDGMFSHIMVGTNDMARSKKFYDALFATLGSGPGAEDARGRVAYSHNGGRFMLTKPIDGKPATVLNGGTIGFQMKDAAQAEAWHKAGVANGGTSVEDPPGVRPNGAYLAYLRDPDGHKLVGLARPAG
jgi:catechol 2,3-dioxygenase-like lactoylglutathione lyase family enzyme